MDRTIALATAETNIFVAQEVGDFMSFVPSFPTERAENDNLSHAHIVMTMTMFLTMTLLITMTTFITMTMCMTMYRYNTIQYNTIQCNTI